MVIELNLTKLLAVLGALLIGAIAVLLYFGWEIHIVRPSKTSNSRELAGTSKAPSRWQQ